MEHPGGLGPYRPLARGKLELLIMGPVLCIAADDRKAVFAAVAGPRSPMAGPFVHAVLPLDGLGPVFLYKPALSHPLYVGIALE